MDVIDPTTGPPGRVVLAGLYPFLHEGARYDLTLAAALLKAECLVQSECTIPGSMVLEEPALRMLCRQNASLIKAGALVLDLRSTVSSFRQLATEKFVQNVSDDILRMADYLDETCPKVLSFDPATSSSRFTERMKGFLQEMRDSAETGLEKHATDRLIDQLDRRDTLLSLPDARAMHTNIGKLDRRIESAAKFFYCISPVESLRSFVEVPQNLWKEVHKDRREAYIDPNRAREANDLSLAHNAILKHFAVAVDALSRLTPGDVLDLRADGATKQAIAQMQKIVDDVGQEFAERHEVNPNSLALLAEIERYIAERIQDKALAQARRSGGDELGGMALDELAADLVSFAHLLVPGIGLARQGLLRLGRVLSRKVPHATQADFTLSPIQLYVARLQKRIAAQPSH